MVEPGVTCIGFESSYGRPTDITGVNRESAAQAEPRADPDGPTQTIALRKGSPAINKAKRSTAPTKDQRGRKRGRETDIGAFERNTGRRGS